MQISLVSLILVLSNLIAINLTPIDITSQCVFEEKQILSNCYWHGAMSVNEVIIRNQTEFEEYGNRIKNKDALNCENALLPIIDFSKFSLVAKITKGACCSANYKRKVESDSKSKKIVYSIEVEHRGSCEMLCFNYNWVKIPKIPVNYKVEFDISIKSNSDGLKYGSSQIDSLNEIRVKLKSQLDSIHSQLDILDKNIRYLESKKKTKY